MQGQKNVAETNVMMKIKRCNRNPIIRSNNHGSIYKTRIMRQYKLS